MDYYSAIKNNDFIKFACTWMELENILSEVILSPMNTQGMHSLIKWMLVQYFEIPKIQFTDCKKPKKKEDQNMDGSMLLRRGNKILTGGNMETKCGAETEGKAASETAPPGDPSHIQLPNPDTIVFTGNCLLTGA